MDFLVTMEFENGITALQLQNTGNVMLETMRNTWFPGPTRDIHSTSVVHPQQPDVYCRRVMHSVECR